MGLMDLFLSREKKLARHIRRLTNRDAQREDRDISAHWLTDEGSPQAILGLLARFDVKVDNQLKDSDEKDFIRSLLIGLGAERVVPPLKVWLRQCKQFALPLRLLGEFTSDDDAIEIVYELLAHEHQKDDFKPEKKLGLLVWLSRVQHAGCVAAALPFLSDFDEGVRCAAAEVIIVQPQQDDEIQRALWDALCNPKEESNRLRIRIAEVFAARRWKALADSALLPESYTIRKGVVVQA